jgi:2-polyprenyl-6-methoxyphenol hydroxylase-like FAD-dependent oxidoreductase
MNYDVIIAGGGPTGLWLACELALARARVVVIEKLAEPTGHSKALGLQSRSMEMLEYRGILDRFTAGNPAPPFLNGDSPDPRSPNELTRLIACGRPYSPPYRSIAPASP